MTMFKQNSNGKKTGSQAQFFPGKLHDMMEYVEQAGLESTLSWVLNGRGFMIHDSEKLVGILPMFFGQTKYRSFRRQLNMWHFETIMDGPNKGACTHPYFVRDKKDLCECMSRLVYMKPQKKVATSTKTFKKDNKQDNKPDNSKVDSFFISSKNVSIEAKDHKTLEHNNHNPTNVSSLYTGPIPTFSNQTKCHIEPMKDFGSCSSYDLTPLSLEYLGQKSETMNEMLHLALEDLSDWVESDKQANLSKEIGDDMLQDTFIEEGLPLADVLISCFDATDSDSEIFP